MTTYGVTPAGFVRKPLTVIQAELKAAVLSTIDPGLDVADDQPLGQLLGIFAAREDAIWQILEVAYHATDRGYAEQALLDNIGGLTGTKRLGQTPSRVVCTATFTQAGTYAAGTLAAYITGAPSQQWVNAFPIVVGTIGGDEVNPISGSNPLPILGLIWQSTADGPLYGDALNAATSLHGGVGTLDALVPVAGWMALADTQAPTLGTLVEQDTPYRLRQRAELAAPGSATLDAIRAAILNALEALNLTPAPTVQMYENTTLTRDTNGLPGKSFMAVVFDNDPVGGDVTTHDQAIGNALWANKPSGMQSYGLHPVTVLDSEGDQQVVSFTRAASLGVTITLDFYVAPGTTTGVQSAIAAAIAVAIQAAAQGEPFSMYGGTIVPTSDAPTTLTPGKDVILNAFRSIADAQPGVLDVQNFTMVSSATTSPNGNIVIGILQKAKITSVTATPHIFDPAA